MLSGKPQLYGSGEYQGVQLLGRIRIFRTKFEIVLTKVFGYRSDSRAFTLKATCVRSIE